MDTNLFELKNSSKQLIQNLIGRIDIVCNDLQSKNIERMQFWLEDFSIFTEVLMILIQNNIIEIEIDIFNEKLELLLDKVEEKDFLFVSDILQFEILPFLIYLDGCMKND